MRWYFTTWNDENVRVEVVLKVWLGRYGKREIAAMHLRL